MWGFNLKGFQYILTVNAWINSSKFFEHSCFFMSLKNVKKKFSVTF